MTNLAPPLKSVRVVVLATDSSGSPDLLNFTIECTQKEYDNGDHYDMAKSLASNIGYSEPSMAFDEKDAAWQRMKDFAVKELPVASSSKDDGLPKASLCLAFNQLGFWGDGSIPSTNGFVQDMRHALLTVKPEDFYQLPGLVESGFEVVKLDLKSALSSGIKCLPSFVYLSEAAGNIVQAANEKSRVLDVENAAELMILELSDALVNISGLTDAFNPLLESVLMRRVSVEQDASQLTAAERSSRPSHG